MPAPASVHASLRPYQQQGLNWLQFLRAQGLGGILADDMGLGKTLQTLADIQVEKTRAASRPPRLVIAPVSLMGNWHSEAARFRPGLRTLVLHGAGRHEWPIRCPSTTWSLPLTHCCSATVSAGCSCSGIWWCSDEAQNIKNASTNVAQVVSHCRRGTGLRLLAHPWKTTWARSGACSTS